MGEAYANKVESEDARLFEDALRRFEEGDHIGAIIQLKNNLKNNPANLPARILIGRAYLAVGDALAAEKELRRARLEGGDDELIAVPLASALLLMRRNKEILDSISVEGRGRDVEFGLSVIRGQAFLGLLKMPQAEESFNKALELRPESASALVGLARVSLARAEVYAARDFSKRSLESEPENFYAWYINGQVAQRLGDMEGAIKSYDKSIEFGPDHLPTRIARAMGLIQLGRHEDAVEDYKVLQKRLPNSPYTAYVDAYVKLRDRDTIGYEHGLQRANTLLRGLDREELLRDPRLLLLAGLINFALGNYNDAYNYLREHITRNKFHSGSRSVLSRLMLRRGEIRNALTMIQTAVDLSPENPDMLQLLGAIQMRNGFHEEAASSFNKAIDLRPESSSIRADLARSHLQSGNTEKAVVVLRDLLDRDPKDIKPGIMLALIMLKQGDYAETIRISKIVTSRAPNSPAGFNLMASAQWAQGDEKSARENLNRAIAIDPEYISAHRNLAKIDMKTGAVEAAKKRYQAMLKMPGAGVKPLVDLARIAAREGQLREAISLMSKAREQDQDNIEIELDLVALLGRSGDGDAALRNVRKLRDRFPDNPAVAEKLGHTELAFGKIEDAAKAYRRVSEAIVGNAEQLLRVARHQIRANDLPGAHYSLKRALVADGSNLGVLEEIVALESRLELYEDALLRSEQIIRQFPDQAVGNRLLGDVLTKLRRFSEAAVAYDAAIRKKRSGRLLVRRYLAQKASGTALPSLTALEEWTKKNPNDYLTRRTLAAAYLAAEKTEAAIGLYEELAAVFKNDPIVLNNLAGLYFKKGDSRALEAAEAAFRLAPKQAQTLDTLGWILVQKGETGRGLELLRDAFSRASRRPLVRYHLAVALSKQGRKTEAREHLEVILSTDGVAQEISEKSKQLLIQLKGG